MQDTVLRPLCQRTSRPLDVQLHTCACRQTALQFQMQALDNKNFTKQVQQPMSMRSQHPCTGFRTVHLFGDAAGHVESSTPVQHSGVGQSVWHCATARLTTQSITKKKLTSTESKQHLTTTDCNLASLAGSSGCLPSDMQHVWLHTHIALLALRQANACSYCWCRCC